MNSSKRGQEETSASQCWRENHKSHDCQSACTPASRCGNRSRRGLVWNRRSDGPHQIKETLRRTELGNRQHPGAALQCSATRTTTGEFSRDLKVSLERRRRHPRDERQELAQKPLLRGRRTVAENQARTAAKTQTIARAAASGTRLGGSLTLVAGHRPCPAEAMPKLLTAGLVTPLGCREGQVGPQIAFSGLRRRQKRCTRAEFRGVSNAQAPHHRASARRAVPPGAGKAGAIRHAFREFV